MLISFAIVQFAPGGPVERVIARCLERGINPGYPLGRDYPEHPDGLLVAITEQRTRADIDRLADVLGSAVADLRDAPRVTDQREKTEVGA